MFKRKIYDKLLSWKQESDGRTALLIEGARRVGKSTVVEEFGKNEYESYILIDFSVASKAVRDLFEDISDLNYFFLQLQLLYRVDLVERKSLIIFDEVQLCPKARQAIKSLVKDRRYDYVETGSLISIRKNVKDILIPSEERKISMYPMDYEEFLWAVGDRTTYPLIRKCFESGKPIKCTQFSHNNNAIINLKNQKMSLDTASHFERKSTKQKRESVKSRPFAVRLSMFSQS